MAKNDNHLYHKVTPLSSHPTDLPPTRHDRVIKQGVSVWESDKVVIHTVADQHTGIHRNSEEDKRYFRWEVSEKWGFRQTPTGLVVPFLKRSRQGWSGPGYVFSILEFGNNQPFFENESFEIFRQAVSRKWGITTIKDVYPITNFHLARYEQIPQNLLEAFRENDYNSFVRKAFGTTRYRKDLVKACANTNLAIISIARWFRGLVPIDWIVDFLKRHSNDELTVSRLGRRLQEDRSLPYEAKMRRLLKAIDQRSLKHILKSILVAHVISNFAWQSNRNFHPDTDRIYRSWDDLHDVIVPDYQLQEIQHEEPIELDDFAKSLQGVKIPVYYGNSQPVVDGKQKVYEEFSILMPDHMKVVREWGHVMHNCIGGYSDRARRHGTYLGAIVGQNGKVIANFQIDPIKSFVVAQKRNKKQGQSEVKNTGYKLIQFFGPCNRPVAKELHEAFYAFLKSRKIGTENAYGGERADFLIRDEPDLQLARWERELVIPAPVDNIHEGMVQW